MEGQNETLHITFHDISSLLPWLSLGIVYHIYILYAYDLVSLKDFMTFHLYGKQKHLWVGSTLFIWPSANYLVYVAEQSSLFISEANS